MKTHRINIFLALILFTAGLVLADLSPAKAQSRGDMESLAVQAVAVWNLGDMAIADQIFSPDFIFEFVDNKDPKMSPEIKGTAKRWIILNGLKKLIPT